MFYHYHLTMVYSNYWSKTSHHMLCRRFLMSQYSNAFKVPVEYSLFIFCLGKTIVLNLEYVSVVLRGYCTPTPDKHVKELKNSNGILVGSWFLGYISKLLKCCLNNISRTSWPTLIFRLLLSSLGNLL